MSDSSGNIVTDIEQIIAAHTPRDTGSSIKLPIEGMMCTACALRVERNLGALPGVKSAVVNYATEDAMVRFDEAPIPVEDLIASVEHSGYTVHAARAETILNGADCDALVDTLKSNLSDWNGILGVSCRPDGDDTLVQVEYIPGMVSSEALEKEFLSVHADSHLILPGEHDETRQEKRISELTRNLWIAAIFTVPVAVISMAHGIIQIPYQNWVLLALVLPVIFVSGREFFVLAARAARHRASDMNTLVALGVGSAFLYSLAAVLFPSFFLTAGQMPDIYFEAAAIIVTLILLGRLIEERAKGKTSGAIKKLLELQPDEARVIRSGHELVLPTNQVRLGDIVWIKPGERVSVDGQITDGETNINESMLTGEPIPVAKSVGDTVSAGTMNLSGSVMVEVTRIGQDTVLNQIVTLVQQAQSTKAPIQKLADKIASIFVPAVLIIATITGIVWLAWGPEPVVNHALLRFVTVLIIACPCALGLATPTAIVVGTGRAAAQGILLRDGEAIQNAGAVTTVALDKTGTLTKGEPEVRDVRVAAGYARNDVLSRAAAVELHSEHPIGEAIVRAATQEGLNVRDVSYFDSESGFGVTGIVDRHKVVIGNRAYLERHQVAMDESVNFEDWDAKGFTTVFVGYEQKWMGSIAVADTIRPTSREAVQDLKSLELSVLLISGDQESSAREIGKLAGIDNVIANVKPQEKSALVRELQEKGEKVAMVGDGINDAPALAQADIGVAIGGGTDIAIEASDITLVKDDLRDAVNAFRLSRNTMKIIRQNLFFAFIYNVICIPVAAGILYPTLGIVLSPVIASAAMALSSVSVVSNSLRLRKLI